MLPDFQWSHLHRSKEQIQTRNIDTRITLQISSNIKTYHVYISSYQVIECDSVKISDESKNVLDIVDRASGQITDEVVLSGRPNNIAVTKDGGR